MPRSLPFLTGSAALAMALFSAPLAAETLQEALAAAYNNNPTLAGARAGQRGSRALAIWSVALSGADAGTAVDTRHRVDVEHLRRGEPGLVRRRVDAVDRAGVDA